MKFNIKHDSKNQKFFTIIGGKECILKYDKISEGVFHLKLIFVPKNLRGQGIAGRIVEFVMHYSKKNMIKVKVSCSYIERFLNAHKEYAELIYQKDELFLQEG